MKKFAASGAALVCLALTGCSLLPGGFGPPATPERTVTVTAQPTTAVTPGESGSRPRPTIELTVGGRTPSPGTRTTKATTKDGGRRISVDIAAFMSPSGRMACVISNGTDDWLGVRCDFNGTPNWRVKKPKGCTLDWGQSITLTRRAVPTCAGDTVLGTAELGSDYARWHTAKDPVTRLNGKRQAALGYGDTLIAGPYRCTMRTSGLTCTNTSTKASFFMSRERVSLS